VARPVIPVIYVDPTIDAAYGARLNGHLMNRSRVIVSLVGAIVLSACVELVEVALWVGPEAFKPDPYSKLTSSPDKVVTAGDTVALVPIVADDIDQSDLDYEWRQVKGPDVRIDVHTDGSARFVAPEVEGMDEIIVSLRILASDEPVQEDRYVVYVGALHP